MQVCKFKLNILSLWITQGGQNHFQEGQNAPFAPPLEKSLQINRLEIGIMSYQGVVHKMMCLFSNTRMAMTCVTILCYQKINSFTSSINYYSVYDISWKRYTYVISYAFYQELPNIISSEVRNAKNLYPH